jgi:hypothetical protein
MIAVRVSADGMGTANCRAATLGFLLLIAAMTIGVGVQVSEAQGKKTKEGGDGAAPLLSPDKTIQVSVSEDGAVVKGFDPQTGKELWSTKRPQQKNTLMCFPAKDSPASKFTLLYLAGSDGRVWCLNARTGAVLWYSSAGKDGQRFTSLSFDSEKDQVVAEIGDSRIRFNSRDGKLMVREIAKVEISPATGRPEVNQGKKTKDGAALQEKPGPIVKGWGEADVAKLKSTLRELELTDNEIAQIIVDAQAVETAIGLNEFALDPIKANGLKGKKAKELIDSYLKKLKDIK